MTKKEWKKPELIVLLRGKPEEVLTNNCKVVGALRGPAGNSQGCGDSIDTNCGSCQGRGGGVS
ncbi:MAG: hypothetical protein BWY83_00291 [bacterium ADurb.Bin478]|nr:hypothetical protein [bacterium]OPZ73099.1 MAG: hypothetical protein BWY83_00291 [bacterium ADurb.Bin478]